MRHSKPARVTPELLAELEALVPLAPLHVVPISHSQDTPGPMTASVREAAALLTAIAGSDPADPATAEADRRKIDYVAALHDGR